ncbi:oxidoreductase [Bacillus songklensis]|uniref:Oxidoreductase n=1 Tax=Bacillus songklensis TaxID=1069116 RepID=A0ABV8B2F9_9BACI
MSQKSAVLLGATGLVGRELLSLLLQSNVYSQVTILVRNKLLIQHEKLRQVEINFDELHKYEDEFNVDDVFCCLGTTMKKAKTKANFLKVDYEYPLAAAKLAEKKRARNFLTITAIGADLRSPIFYNKVKGQTEEDICNLYIRSTHFFRPSLLLGQRSEFRLGEKIGEYVLKSISLCLIGKWRKFKPIKAENVAKAMLEAALEERSGVHVHESDVIYYGNCQGAVTN